MLHASNYFLHQSDFKATVGDMDRLMVFVAAIVHDFDHPGLRYVPPPRAIVAAPVRSGPPPLPRRRDGALDGVFGNIKPIVRKVPMQSFSLDRSGAFTVTLADGQVWKQNDEDETHHPAHWGEAGPSTLVSIAPDAMSTYTMTIDGQQRMYKVHRVR